MRAHDGPEYEGLKLWVVVSNRPQLANVLREDSNTEAEYFVRYSGFRSCGLEIARIMVAI